MTKFQKNPGSPYSIIHDNTVSSLDAARHSARAEEILTPSTSSTPGTLVSSKAVLSGTEWRKARA
jgi:hypothetical protein